MDMIDFITCQTLLGHLMSNYIYKGKNCVFGQQSLSNTGFIKHTEVIIPKSAQQYWIHKTPYNCSCIEILWI